jgi:uncharacterized protein
MVERFTRANKLLAFILFILILITSSINVWAAEQLVYDEASLLTKSEIEEIEAEASALSESHNMDIVIVTTEDAQGKSSRAYADDFFDYGGFGVGPDYDGILFLIDMDNREAYISTSGKGIKYLTDERIERVLDEVFDSGLSDGDYYGAVRGFLSGTQRYLEAGIPDNQYIYEERVKSISSIDVIIALGGGIIAGALFYISVKARYAMRNPGNSFSYKTNSIVNMANTEDRLIDTFVTHRIIPKPTNNNRPGGGGGGRSTVHRSSSGRSHGGGGRKF